MSISRSKKVVNSRQAQAKLKGESTVEVENNQGQAVNNDQIAQDTDKSEETGTLAIPVLHDSSGHDLQIVGTISVAGIRPISASNLAVAYTIDVMGIRPIGANTINIVDSINLSGLRPISSSALVISDNYSVMGNRPIASNIIDNSEILMGFID